MTATLRRGVPLPLRENLSHDALASLVVFFVALPLCMGIAIASGLDPAAGLITGVIGGVLVGSISGAPLQVSGPAAGLAVIVYQLVQTHGVKALGPVLVIAGLVQLLAAVFKLGLWFRAVSPAVVEGMLAGIGLLIVASQFHVAIDGAPKSGGLENLAAIPSALWQATTQLNSSSHWAGRVALITILLICTWKMLAPRRLAVIPGQLVAVVLAAALANFLGLSIQHVAVPDKFFEALRLPGTAELAFFSNPGIWVAGIGVALVASAETLLCATAVDQLHTGPRTRYNRELAAQGIGNALCGLLGGLPMTGVIVRSAANVEAGGRTRLSTMLHGIWILAAVCFAPFLLRLIPTCSLAAILVYTGYKLMNPKQIVSLWRHGKSEVFIYAVTMTLVVVEDLLVGVLAGLACAAVMLLLRLSRLEIRIEHSQAKNRTTVQLIGSATFLRLPKLAAALEQIPSDIDAHLQLEQLQYVDHACFDLLDQWERQRRAGGGRTVVDSSALAATSVAAAFSLRVGEVIGPVRVPVPATAAVGSEFEMRA